MPPTKEAQLNQPQHIDTAQQQNKEKLKDLLKDWDYQTFLRKKEKLFEKILQWRTYITDPSLEVEDKLWEIVSTGYLVDRVMQHDLEDGLLLAEKVQRRMESYQKLLTSAQFVIRYPKLMGKVIKKVEKNKDNLPTKNQERWNYIVYSHDDILQQIATNAISPDYWENANKPFAKQAKALYNEIDELYAPLLRNTQLENIEETDPRTPGEKMGEGYLQTAQYLGQYKTASIITHIYNKHIKPNKKTQKEIGWDDVKEEVINFLIKNLPEASVKSFRKVCIKRMGQKEFISWVSLHPMLNVFGHTSLFDDFNLEQAQYKPLNLTFNMKNHLAEKYNKEELEKMLTKNHGEHTQLLRNPELGKYEVRFSERNKSLKPEEKRIDISKCKPVWLFENINGKIFFMASDNGKFAMFNEDGRQISKEYDKIIYSQNINGKLVFVAELDNRRFAIFNEDGKKITKEYDYIMYPKDINWKLVFVAELDNGKYAIFNEDGKKITKEYDSIRKPQNINGKVVFRAKLDNGRYAIFNEDGRQIGKEYNDIGDIQNINGKLVFKASLNNIRYAIFNDGRQISKEYNDVGDPQNINGKLVFKAKLDNGLWVIVNEEGKHISKQYSRVGDPQNINGKITFRVNFEYSMWIVNEDGEVISSGYAEVNDPQNINGKMVFKARFGDKWMVVNEDDKTRSEEFDSIPILTEHQGGLFYCAKKWKELIIHREGQTNSKQLTPTEQEKLNLLNLCIPLKHKLNDLTSFQREIATYFHKKEEEAKQENNRRNKLKQQVSKANLAAINQMIKTYPQLFINTISPFKPRHPDHLVDKLIQRMFPEILNTDSQKKSDFWWKLGLNGGIGNLPDGEASSLLRHQESQNLDGGNPESTETTEAQEILELRDKIDDMIITTLLGEADKKNGSRKQVDFPVTNPAFWPKKETTITIPNPSQGNLVLSKPLHATLIPQRTKAHTDQKQEKYLESYTNALGISTTHIKEEVNHLKYSIEIPLLPPPLLSISADEYKSFKDQFPHQQLSTPLLTFDRETDFFLTSLKTLPLDQQLTNIEQYVRQHAFYDMKNAEVNGLKFQKPNQERLFICEQRIQQLTTEHPELATQLQGKKRAGVCADFALITTAMLRQAGILAGVSKGFLPDGKKVTTKHAHACSFAILPYKKKENQIILIDGTPHNTEVQPLASLTEREQQYTKQQQLLTKEMMEKSEKIQQIIEQHNNPEEIKKHLQPLCNGELEDVMNTFLHTTVTPKHYQRISNLLNAYRYSPIATSENLEEIKTFLSSQLSHPSDTIIKEEETGTQLFEILRTFLTRFEKNHKSLSAFDVLDSLIELSKDSLDTNEYFALTLISRYLKAEKMFL